jgi:hypothetical protein
MKELLRAKMNRRLLLKGAGAGAAGYMLSGCGFGENEKEAHTSSSDPSTTTSIAETRVSTVEIFPTILAGETPTPIQSTEVPLLPTNASTSTVSSVEPTQSPVFSFPKKWWQVTSIDTMKVSRDMAQNTIDVTDEVIDLNARLVADAGSTHMAIGTPYDKEFIPVMKRWIEAGRKHNINIWFRGNFSGWENENNSGHGWFNYPLLESISEHHELTKRFLQTHVDLFKSGDIFTSCPEPENGHLINGFWRSEQDKENLRKFMVDSYRICEAGFQKIAQETGENVSYGYFSHNGDVAKAIGRETATLIGRKVGLDHYVYDTAEMGAWIDDTQATYGGDIELFLGEYGAPRDNTPMDPKIQAEFIDTMLREEITPRKLHAVNYWVLSNGNTALYDQTGEKPSYKVIQSYYTTNNSA